MAQKIKLNKVGQAATIWIIIAILIVAALLIYFFFSQNPEIIGPSGGDSVFDMQSFLDERTTKYVKEAVDLMALQGGFISPKNSVIFNNTNIEFLCKNIGFYEPCITQHPMLLNEMKKEIVAYLQPRINTCLDELRQEVTRRDGTIVYGNELPVLNVDLGPDRVFVNIKKTATITKREEVRRFEEFDVSVISPLYSLGSVAVEIAAQEAQYCYFEYVGYSILYPRFVVTKYVMSEPTKIYTIQDKNSGKTMNIAIRSCAIPPGF